MAPTVADCRWAGYFCASKIDEIKKSIEDSNKRLKVLERNVTTTEKEYNDCKSQLEPIREQCNPTSTTPTSGAGLIVELETTEMLQARIRRDLAQLSARTHKRPSELLQTIQSHPDAILDAIHSE